MSRQEFIQHQNDMDDTEPDTDWLAEQGDDLEWCPQCGLWLWDRFREAYRTRCECGWSAENES